MENMKDSYIPKPELVYVPEQKFIMIRRGNLIVKNFHKR